MAVNIPNSSVYQSQLGQHVVAMREALQTLLNDAAYLNAMGGATFLQNSLGISPADATNIVNVIGGVIPTNATVVSLQNWINTTEFLWGAQ